MEISSETQPDNGRSDVDWSVFKSGDVRAICIGNFLKQDERDQIYTTVCQSAHLFKYPNPFSEEDETMKLLVLKEHGQEPDEQPFRSVDKVLSSRLLQSIPDFLQTLDKESFVFSRGDRVYMNGQNGQYASPHTDTSDGKQQLTILYYFFKEPRAFQGGNLELYSTDSNSELLHSVAPVVSFELKDNMLIVFPSEIYHGVTKLEMSSNRFEDGRFVVVEFLSLSSNHAGVS